MAILIQKIRTNLTEAISDSLIGIHSINAEVHETTCNHILAPGFEAFIFDFSKVTSTETLITDSNYGLIFNNKKTFTDINISY
jgi:hypothetical protein